jgi:hypothetical protein
LERLAALARERRLFMRWALISCICWAVALAWVVPVGFAVGAEPISTEELVRRLGSGDFAEREQAAALLRRRGPVVLPALKKALTSRIPEVRRRAKELVRILEATLSLRPKLVSLGEDVGQLSDAVKAIRKETGYPLVLDPKVADRAWTHPVQRVPFWEAVATIEQKTGLVAGVYPLEQGIQLKPGKKKAPFSVVNGPFRLEVTGFHEDRDIDFTVPGPARYRGRHDHLLTMAVRILAEPPFLLLGVEPGEVEVAVDEHGKPLRKAKATSDEEKGVRRLKKVYRQQFEHHAQVVLRRSSEEAEKIRTLRCAIPVLVVAERKPIVVSENLLKAAGAKCQSGGDTLEISDVSRDDRGTVYLRFKIPPPRPEVNSYWHDRVRVEDAMGNPFESNAFGDGHSGGQYHFSLGYPATSKTTVGPPTRLIVEDWVILRHRITFELKDVPLP